MCVMFVMTNGCFFGQRIFWEEMSFHVFFYHNRMNHLSSQQSSGWKMPVPVNKKILKKRQHFFLLFSNKEAWRVEKRLVRVTNFHLSLHKYVQRERLVQDWSEDFSENLNFVRFG